MLSRSAMAKFRKAGRIAHEVKTDIPSVNNASGRAMPIDGAFMCRFLLDNVPTSGIFLVSPELNAEAIIGCNIIRSENLIFDPELDKVIRKTTTVPGTVHSWSSADVLMVSDCTIDPCQARKCTLRVVDKDKAPICHTDMLVSLGGPIGATYAVRTSVNGTFTMHVPNATTNQISIDRRTCIGSAFPMSQWMIVPGSQTSAVDALSVMMAHPSTPNTDPMKDPRPPHRQPGSASEAVKTAIRASVKKTVPPQHQPAYLELLLEFADCFSEHKFDLGYNDQVAHKIAMRDQEPVYRSQFRIPEEHMDLIRSSVQAWLRIGIIQPSNSLYNSPIFCVSKKEGQGLRVVLDYRAINAHSLPDRYSIKTVEECIADIGRARSKVFASLDQRSGFWQQKLDEDSRKFTAFTIPGLGQFEYVTCPMGLTGSPASFSRLMDLVMQGLPNTITYIDDTLVHAPDHPSLLRHLRDTLLRFRKANLKLNAEKCIFGSSSVQYLGHTLTAGGVTPGECKLRAIQETKPPKNIKQLKSFIGLVNYFRNYVRDFARKCAPLNALTRNNSEWQEGDLPEEAMAAFLQLRELLLQKPVLSYPTRDGKFHLYVDAALGDEDNAGGLGAVLMQQQPDGNKGVIGYASRQLQKHEKNYPAGLLEQAACVYGMEFFQQHLKGRPFVLYTDHRPIESLSKVHTKTLKNLHLKMLELQPEIRYISGKDNTIADFLSRYQGLGCAMVDTSQFRVRYLQQHDPVLRPLLDIAYQEADAEDADKTFSLPGFKWEFALASGILMVRLNKRKGFITDHRFKVVAPKALTHELIQEAHNSLLGGHMGCFKTLERIRQDFWWPAMEEDIKSHVKRCETCQKCTNKNDSDPVSPLQPLPQPRRPNERVHIDLWGPNKTSDNNNTFVLVMTDAFTKIVRLAAIPDKSATTVAKAILDGWIYIYGVPKTILTDNGLEFCNQLNEALWNSLGIEHKRTTPFHPQTNSSAEVFNKTIQHFLTTTLAEAEAKHLDWEWLLGPLMLSFNTAVHKSTRVSPFYAMFGYDPRMPMWSNVDITNFDEKVTKPDYAKDLLNHRKAQHIAREAAYHNNQHSRETYKDNFDKSNKAAFPDYMAGDMVWLKYTDASAPNRKMAVKWEPGIIEETTANPAVFRVRRINRTRKPVIRINVQQMKRRLPPPDAQQQQQQQSAQQQQQQHHPTSQPEPPQPSQPSPIPTPPLLQHETSTPEQQPPQHIQTRHQQQQRPFTRSEARRQRTMQPELDSLHAEVKKFVESVAYDWMCASPEVEDAIQLVLDGKASFTNAFCPPPKHPSPPPLPSRGSTNTLPAPPSHYPPTQALPTFQLYPWDALHPGQPRGWALLPAQQLSPHHGRGEQQPEEQFFDAEEDFRTPDSSPLQDFADARQTSSRKSKRIKTPRMVERLKDHLSDTFKSTVKGRTRAQAKQNIANHNDIMEDEQHHDDTAAISSSARLSSRLRQHHWPVPEHHDEHPHTRTPSSPTRTFQCDPTRTFQCDPTRTSQCDSTRTFQCDPPPFFESRPPRP